MTHAAATVIAAAAAVAVHPFLPRRIFDFASLLLLLPNSLRKKYLFPALSSPKALARLRLQTFLGRTTGKGSQGSRRGKDGDGGKREGGIDHRLTATAAEARRISKGEMRFMLGKKEEEEEREGGRKKRIHPHCRHSLFLSCLPPFLVSSSPPFASLLPR